MENSTLEKLLIQLQKDFRNTVEILKPHINLSGGGSNSPTPRTIKLT